MEIIIYIRYCYHHILELVVDIVVVVGMVGLGT